MRIFSYTHEGYDGYVIAIEVDVRNGIPATMIVGLAGHAIQEARERVRISLKNSGFVYPDRRVVINLSPASLPKTGTAFDMAIAYALLVHTEQIPRLDHDIMLLGELHLDGSVGAVSGVISAVHEGLCNGITTFMVPHQNYHEAHVLREARVVPISSLHQLRHIAHDIAASHGVASHGAASHGVASHGVKTPSPRRPVTARHDSPIGKYGLEHILGHSRLKRVIEIAVAGNHHCLFIGPPGCGKTLSARVMSSLTTPLSTAESIEITRIFSIANLLHPHTELISHPPFRAPHHSISYAGMLGGGDPVSPGEIALAHNGILLLDEALEFRRDVLQGLRQPLEEREIRIARSHRTVRFPSDFLLVMTANICPCGNFGKQTGSCFCKMNEIKKYWKRLGGAFLDRIPLRCVLTTELDASPPSDANPTKVAADTMSRIQSAVATQCRRYHGSTMRRNGHLKADTIARHCVLSPKQTDALYAHAKKHHLSHRAVHTVQTVALTIADLDGEKHITDAHLHESIMLRNIIADAQSDYSSDIVSSLLN